MKKKMLFVIVATLCCSLAFSQDWSTLDLDSLLCEVYDKDQTIRSDMQYVYSLDADSAERMEYIETQNRIDEENQQIVSSILDTIGWPEGLSEKANMGIFLTIDHGSRSYMEKYVGWMKEQSEKKVIAADLYPTLYDRLLMRSGKKQIYGTQTFALPDGAGGSTLHLWPLENIDGIDELRSTVGLMPLNDYLISFKDFIGCVCTWEKDLRIEDIPEWCYRY